MRAETKTARRILVVDDDPSLRATTRMILQHKGYEVSLARDGNEAIERTHTCKFDVILMDIRMPGMNGVEVIDELRRSGDCPSIVLMTAYSMEDIVDRALEMGAIAVLRKPVDVDRLLTLLDEICLDPSRGRL